MPASTPFDHWADAYDLMDRDTRPFVDFYTSLVTPQTRSVIELGCGTGTILTAIVHAIERHRLPERVVGIDEAERMLAVARARLPGAEWIRGDMRAPGVAGAFDLVVCCFNTLQLLPRDEDAAAALRAARELLAPEGLFAFDVYRPNLDYLRRGHTDRLARVAVDDRGHQLETREDIRYDEERRVVIIDWRQVAVTDPGSRPLAEARFEMRQYFPEDLERLLAGAGLEILHRYGDLDRSPFTATAKRQVLVCRAVAG